MPSRKSKLILNALHSGKDLFSRLGNVILQAGTPLPEPIVARLPAEGVASEPLGVSGDLPALLLKPGGMKEMPRKVILHCHGGAYVSGGLLQAKALAALVCQNAQLPVVTFAYRLAPKDPYPAAVQDALRMWRFLREHGYQPQDVALVGESAGGNLCLALCQALRSLGEPLPAGLSLLSPWADLVQEGESYRTLKDVDATLNGPELYRSALDYAGGDAALLRDPMLSPVFADFSGFPPVQLHVGTRELLLSDSETLYLRMKQQEVRATILRWEGMCHVFQAFGFPESKLSLKAAGIFLRQVLSLTPLNEEETDGSV